MTGKPFPSPVIIRKRPAISQAEKIARWDQTPGMTGKAFPSPVIICRRPLDDQTLCSAFPRRKNCRLELGAAVTGKRSFRLSSAGACLSKHLPRIQQHWLNTPILPKIHPLTQSSHASLQELLHEDPLYVFALQIEAATAFTHVDTLFTGVGKLHTAYSLLKRIQEKKPSLLINLGSAGSNTFQRGEVVNCTRFIQRDMDVTALGFEKYQTPFSTDPVVLEYGFSVSGLPQGICGSGDSFEVDHRVTQYDVIDMEAFTIAWIAQQEKIPFLCLKYISDGADGKAAEQWQEAVKHAALALKAALDQISG
jgi:adenosylhomocysteine nucleosidase